MAYKRAAYRYTGPDLGTVLKVLDRDGHACVRDGAAIRGDRGKDWVIHHRRPRGIGGSRREDTNLPSNLLSLCAPCHDYIESHRAEALENGWLLHQGVDPPSVAVLVAHGSRWVYLNDEAEYADNPVGVS